MIRPKDKFINSQKLLEGFRTPSGNWNTDCEKNRCKKPLETETENEGRDAQTEGSAKDKVEGCGGGIVDRSGYLQYKRTRVRIQPSAIFNKEHLFTVINRIKDENNEKEALNGPSFFKNKTPAKDMRI